MAEPTVARRYAQALLELSLEQDNLERVAAELQRFTDLLNANNSQVLDALCHPGLLPEERMVFLNTLLARYPFEPTVGNFARLALEKGRAALIPQINEALQAMADAQSRRVRALLTTAAPISDALKDEFRAALETSTGKSVLLETRTDPALIGGVTIALGDKVYDASVRSRLQEIRQRLLFARGVAEA